MPRRCPGTPLTLEQDYTAGTDDEALYIPTGKTITIDLNGHTISLKPNTSYKAFVRPFVWKDSKKKSKVYIGKSPVMHSYTSGGDKTISDAKSITITNKEVKKGKVTIAKGKALTIKAGIKYIDSKKMPFPDKHVTTLRYFSTNKSIATVSSTGEIIAKKEGKCTIYVYAHNGVNKAITVTVK